MVSASKKKKRKKLNEVTAEMRERDLTRWNGSPGKNGKHKNKMTRDNSSDNLL